MNIEKIKKFLVPFVISCMITLVIIAYAFYGNNQFEFFTSNFGSYFFVSCIVGVCVSIIYNTYKRSVKIANKQRLESEKLEKNQNHSLTKTKTNVNSTVGVTSKTSSVSTQIFSSELIEQLNGLPCDEMRKKVTKIFENNGKEDAFKYVRMKGYELTKAKELVDSIEKELYDTKKMYRIHSINDSFNIDGMEGHAFEHWCADLLKKSGFANVEVTPASNDQGVDILATKEGVRYAIQCKNYSTPLGNTPVQEVNSGKIYYGCHVGVVMTNSTFTKGAVELAKATGVLLWDGNTIKKIFSNVNTDK